LLNPPGVNVIGYVSGNFGLGIAARSSVARLQAWGHPVAVVDVDPGRGRARRDLSYASLECGRTCPHPTNLFHMNPPQILRYSKQWLPRTTLRSANVCVPFWEMPHLPLEWLPVLRAMDVVMAPSRFIQSAVEADLPDVPVRSYPQAVLLPEGVRADRERWRIPGGAVTFLLTFDPSSDTFRKNPSGALEAFQRAFRSGESVVLVVKLNRSKQAVSRSMDSDLLKLYTVAETDSRIRIVDEHLPYADVLSMYASADVMVSLHRAEGLGLHLMEAMTLGKPVIATGWSGNMDFMTTENSCPVGYRLDRVRSVRRAAKAEAGRPEQTWAEPDVDEAAAWMRRLAGDSGLRSALGERAAFSMKQWNAAANASSPFLEIEKPADIEGLPNRLHRQLKFARLVLRERWRRRLRRWKQKTKSALRIGGNGR
jgi:glycosyltransferase involved in cell wall biosynthesis